MTIREDLKLTVTELVRELAIEHKISFEKAQTLLETCLRTVVVRQEIKDSFTFHHTGELPA